MKLAIVLLLLLALVVLLLGLLALALWGIFERLDSLDAKAAAAR